MVLVYWCFGAAGQFDVALNPVPCIGRVIDAQVAAAIVVAHVVGGVIGAIIFIIVVRVTVFGALVVFVNILVVRGSESTIKQRHGVLFMDFSVNVGEIVLGETGTRIRVCDSCSDGKALTILTAKSAADEGDE